MRSAGDWPYKLDPDWRQEVRFKLGIRTIKAHCCEIPKDPDLRMFVSTTNEKIKHLPGYVGGREVFYYQAKECLIVGLISASDVLLGHGGSQLLSLRRS